MPLLDVRNLDAGYGEVQILRDCNLSLEAGKLTALVGGNGVGKTTLLRTIMGLIKPWKGSVEFAGQEIGNLPAYRKSDLWVVLVPEGRQLFTNMSVFENLEMGATNRRARAKVKENLEKVFTMFPRLAERRDQQAGTLSGGEQQMLAVARGLMAEPTVLMLDELSLGLSPLLVLNLFASLQQLKQTGLTMLLVEQNVHMALTVSDYAYVISEGSVILSGPAGQIAQDEHVRTAYLGI